ncbi:ABC transporter, partial [Paenibacillus riograndensis]
AHILKTIMVGRLSSGRSDFFSTQVVDVAEKLCNKRAIIKGGQLIAHGRTEEVKGKNSLEDVFLELIDND